MRPPRSTRPPSNTGDAVPDGLPLYGLDIETDTAVDGLDPALAAVVAVALATPQGDEVFLGDEADLLLRVDRRLAELPAGVLVTWNGRSFDLPFLAVRARRVGVATDLELWPLQDAPDPPGDWPPPPGGFGGRWGAHAHLDGYRVYSADVRRSLGLSCGLKAMARFVGMTPVQVDYELLHLLPPTDLAAYVASDARLATRLVQRRLPAVLASVDRRPTGSRDPLLDAVGVTGP
jgi:hypothetical protein